MGGTRQHRKKRHICANLPENSTKYQIQAQNIYRKSRAGDTGALSQGQIDTRGIPAPVPVSDVSFRVGDTGVIDTRGISAPVPFPGVDLGAGATGVPSQGQIDIRDILAPVPVPVPDVSFGTVTDPNIPMYNWNRYDEEFSSGMIQPPHSNEPFLHCGHLRRSRLFSHRDGAILVGKRNGILNAIMNASDIMSVPASWNAPLMGQIVGTSNSSDSISMNTSEVSLILCW
jgi:hypothetical protein